MAGYLDDAPYLDLADALLDARDGAVIDVCPGTWPIESATLDAVGGTVTFRSWSGSADDTVLDGQWGDTILEVADGTSVVVEDLTFFQGAVGRLASGGYWGGALFLGSGDHTLSGCAFRETADVGAVGLYSALATEGSLTVLDTLFDGNDNSGINAGFGTDGVVPFVRIDGCTFQDNGMGASFHYTDVVITHSTFTDNDVGLLEGAALRFRSDDPSITLTVSDSTFEGNHASSAPIAWIYTTGDPAIPKPVRFEGCTFLRNEAIDTYGIMLFPGVVATFSECLFQENAANAGSAFGTFGDLTIEDSTFLGETPEHGAAIEMLWSEEDGGIEPNLVVRRTTFEGNSSHHNPILQAYEGPFHISFQDSIFADNAATTAGGYLASILLGGSLPIDFSVSGSTFLGNTGDRNAILVAEGHGTVSFRDTVFDGNLVPDWDVGSILSLSAEGGDLDLDITGGAFTSHVAGTDGAVLVLDGARATVTGVDFGTDATDNVPADVYGCDVDFGMDASFVYDEALGMLCATP